jgi:hypothetical protein
MNLRESRETIGTVVPDADASRVYGEPYETADGATVITVAKAREGRSKPVGVFVIKDGKASWRPAVDGERIAMMGILVGLVSAALAGIAMVRRPPWPDLRGDISQRFYPRPR